MAVAGRVAIVPKGDWSAETEYKRLDEVTYNNTMFIAKKAVPKGTLPTNAEYWSKSIVGGVGAIATKEDAGNVKPADGLSIAEDGTLKVSIDGITLTMDQVNNVIKLADTLKEKINGAFPAANVANNQITTEAGFALDARQANPNLDGTLAKQVADLNGSLNNKADAQYFSHDIYGAWMQAPLSENKYIPRAYVAFNELYGSILGTQILTGEKIESEFAALSSKFGFIPIVVDPTSDLNDVIGNYFMEVLGCKNSPKSGVNFYGLNISWAGNNDFAFQLLIAPYEEQVSGSKTSRMYMRSKNAGTWTAWYVVAGTLLF